MPKSASTDVQTICYQKEVLEPAKKVFHTLGPELRKELYVEIEDLLMSVAKAKASKCNRVLVIDISKVQLHERPPKSVLADVRREIDFYSKQSGKSVSVKVVT